MNFLRIPFAIVALGLLAGCVGPDGPVRLNAAAGSTVASATILEARPTEVLEPAPDVAGVMPGDLLIATRREAASTSPYTVLERRSRVAGFPSPQRSYAERLPQPVAVNGSADGSAGSSQATTFAMAPLAGARRIPSMAPADGSSRATALRTRAGSLSDIEAQAAIEQRAQDERNRRFDAQVKRASGLVCSGCVSTSAPRPARPSGVHNDSDD